MALVLQNPRAPRSTEDPIAGSRVDHPLLELCLTSTKGLGLFAKADIAAGTCVLSEKPLIVLSANDGGIYHDLHQQLAELTSWQSDVFHSLSSRGERLRKSTKRDIELEAVLTRKPLTGDKQLEMEARKISTFTTNATSMSPRPGYAIFPLFSRINHHCTPNVHASYNPTLGAHTVYATRDICAHDELCIAYINPAQVYQSREEDLDAFTIDCHCDSCRPGNMRQASDRKRHSIDQAKRGLAVYDGTAPRKGTKDYEEWEEPDIVPNDPTMALAMAETAVHLMRQERLISLSLCKLHRQASRYALQLGKVDQARSHATSEAQVEMLCSGSETAYVNDTGVEDDGGNAATWMSEIQRMVQRDGVKLRMCEKRVLKETKRAEKKAAKKKGTK